MYTRELTSPPENIIKNGKPTFGCFNKAFDKLDIRGLKRPFGNLPCPVFLSNMRIKATLSFVFSTKEYICSVEFFDSKVFGFVEVILWHIKTGKKYAYRRLLGAHSRIIPKSTKEAVCISVSKKRYIRIMWSKKDQRLSLLFNLQGDEVRPDVSAALNIDLSSKKCGEMASVLPSPVQRRCLASYQITGEMQGTITIVGEKTETDSTGGVGLLDLRRAYYPLRTKNDVMTGVGFAGDKIISFRYSISNLCALDEAKYNDNVLVAEGQVTPLPPVKITHPRGVMKKWVIQDTENMVDLSFTPVSDVVRAFSVLVLHTNYHMVYGTFDGVLKTKEGESITIRNLPGIARKIRLRY